MKFWRHYLQVLIPLAVFFAAYVGLVVPWIEPPEIARDGRLISLRSTPREETRWWESYFLEGSWQRNSPLVIERDQCILLYQEREQISDTRWRFRPLTIVIPQSSEGGGKRAIFIENPKGAEIQFKSAFDWTSGHPPPVVNGQLMGDIKIYSPADESSSSGELLVETRDMRIDKRQIWTTEPIKMKLGNSYVEGRYLSIYMDRDLLSEETPQESADSSPFSGLDFLELFYVDRVEMALRPGGLWPSRKTESQGMRAAQATLKCGGTFVFQFHQSQATLKNGVHMEHRVEGMPVDTFDCNELKLTLGWPDNKSAPTVAASPAVPADSNKWRVDRLEATGSPGRDAADQSTWIRMSAPGMEAEAFGQHLIMDFIHGMVTLSNVLPGTAPRNSSRVFLKRESFQVSSPQVQFQNSDLVHAAGGGKLKRLGWVVADGIGIAQFESPEDSWSLRWSKRLVIRPHDHRDLIMIEGGANVSSAQRGRFIAEKLNMWVSPVTGELADRLMPYYRDRPLPDFVPDTISAEGEVMVSTAELIAQVATMVVRFTYPMPPDQVRFPAPIAATSAASTVGDVAESTAGLQGSGGGLMLSPPAPRNQASDAPELAMMQPLAVSNTNGDANTSRPNKSNPINVQGRSLEAEVIRLGNESVIDGLSIDGDFTLTRGRVTDDSNMPLTATGDRLVLQSESQDVTNIQMVGNPAKVAVGTGWVIAKELQLSQKDQLFWIDHPGELVIPTEAMQPSDGTPLVNNGPIPSLLASGGVSPNNPGERPNPLVWTSAPRVQWGERMTFDGRIARFGGGVTLDCRMQTTPDTLWHVMASASTLTLDLAKRVPLKFQQERGERAASRVNEEPPELQLVRLDGDVDIKAVQTDLQGVRRSTENLIVPRIEFHVPSQTWLGYGPGQLWSRRMGNSNLLDSRNLPGASPSVAPSPPASSNDRPAALQCLHLTFLGRMEGSVQQRLVSFYDKIDSLMGPIATWDDVIDVRKAETLAPNQTRLLCDQLNLFDASGLSYNQTRNGTREAAWELDALGNAQLTSRTDSGDVILDANRLGYAALDDAVRIEGTARRGATIRRLPLVGASRQFDQIQVSSATMRLKTGQLDAQIRKIEGELPPQFQRSLDMLNPTAPGNNSATPPGTSTPAPPSLPSPRDFNPLQPRSGR